MESEIRAAIQEALKELGTAECDFVVEHPTELSHGDYACNVAMVAAKEANRNPRELAEEIVRLIERRKPTYIERVEVAGPGFINFFLSRDFFSEKIAEILKAQDSWGKNEICAGDEILIEYTSPNLFKPLHVGNLVGNIVGESLTRLYEYSGGTVRRLNYPSDIGLTVAKAVWGLQKTNGDPNDITALGEAYRVGNEAYEQEGLEKTEIDEVNTKLYEGGDTELNKLREGGIQTSKGHLDELCSRLGTRFDAEIFESEAGPVGQKIVREHIGDVFTESDGAIVFKGEEEGLHTRVFLNSKGLPTYEAKDLGNFVLKQEKFPNWTHSYIVTGSEQREYFKVLFAAIHKLLPDTKEKIMEHIPTGFLTLSTGKMSSRKGNVLTGEEILSELTAAASEHEREANDETTVQDVAVAALKYQILKQGLGQDIVFDKRKALSFEGDSGPYLQYTHARINSVLEKAKSVQLSPSTEHPPEEPYEIEKILYRFPEIVEKALHEHSPHFVASYLIELAGAFNTFYGRKKIVDTEDEYAPYKLAISEAVKITLKNGLWALGVKAPEHM
jgi:arginyl-tRNA synthetase